MVADAKNEIAKHYNDRENKGLSERRTTKNINIRKVNNAIKLKFIKTYVSKNDKVLDIGFGKGGDIHKYKFCGVSLLYGVDIASRSLLDALERIHEGEFHYDARGSGYKIANSNTESECKSASDHRGSGYKGDNEYKGSAYRSGDGYAANEYKSDNEYKEGEHKTGDGLATGSIHLTSTHHSLAHASSFYRNNDNPQSSAYNYRQSFPPFKIILKTRDLMRELVRFPYKFNVISSQFAFHYSFETEDTLKTVVKNISENLEDNGYFIATVPNKEEILSRLFGGSSANSTGTSDHKSKSLENSLYKIRFTRKPSREKIYGSEYYYSQVDSIDSCIEYLVDIPTLILAFKREGLILVENLSFSEYRKDPKVCDRKRMFLTSEEEDVIDLYDVIAFRKRHNRDCDTDDDRGDEECDNGDDRESKGCDDKKCGGDEGNSNDGTMDNANFLIEDGKEET